MLQHPSPRTTSQINSFYKLKTLRRFTTFSFARQKAKLAPKPVGPLKPLKKIVSAQQYKHAVQLPKEWQVTTDAISFAESQNMRDQAQDLVSVNYRADLYNVTNYFNKMAKSLNHNGHTKSVFKRSIFIFKKMSDRKMRASDHGPYMTAKRELGLEKCEYPSDKRIFQTYVNYTKPIIAYYLNRQRSYKKKRKTYISKYRIMVAKRPNRLGKLFMSVKSIFFKGFTRKKQTCLNSRLMFFFTAEVFEAPKNILHSKKNTIYNKSTENVVNDLILKYRYL